MADYNLNGSTIGWSQADVAEAFVQVQDSIVWTAMDTVIRAVAIFLVLSVVISAIQDAMHKPGGWDIHEISRQLFIGFFTITILTTFNFIINGVNSQFAQMEEELSSSPVLGQSTGDSFMTLVDDFYGRMLADETDQKAEEIADGDSEEDDGGLLSGLTSIFQFLANLGIYLERAIMKVITYPIMWIADFIYNNIYLLYMCGRYIYLLLLELVAPVAIICMLHPQTRGYFLTWTKNLFICHLLLPAFYLANYFSDLLGSRTFEWFANLRVDVAHVDNIGDAYVATTSLFGGTFAADAAYLIGAIVMMLVIKISMLNTVKSKIHNLF